MALLALLATALPATSAELPEDPLSGSGDVGRTLLLAHELGDELAPGSPVDNVAFAVPAQARPPLHTLEGSLELFGEPAAGLQPHKDTHNRAAVPKIDRIPRITVDWVQQGSHLIPVQRGLIFTGNNHWNLIVDPGRIWNENGDGNRSRIALPFSLIERDQNCTHNGALTFLFDGTQPSQAIYQITQETCFYNRFDLWGETTVTFTPGTVSDADSIRTRFQSELAGRLPRKALAELRTDYPRANVKLSAFGAGLRPEHLTTYGVVFDGVHYVGPSRTRYGEYAFPEHQRLPSYSTAKTVFAAAALMRLTQLYGDEVPRQKIRDHVPKIPKKRWQEVTFEHALDMTTGHYRRDGVQQDERDNTTSTSFFLAESLAQKLRAATTYPTQEPPGGKWVYHTTDTFLLTHAMTGYLESKLGAEADLFDWMVDQIYQPLGLNAGSLQPLRTGNSSEGQALGGYGLFLISDDIAKLSLFWGAQRGSIDGEQLLDPNLLAAALQQVPEDRGLDAEHRQVAVKYNNSLWASEVDILDLAGKPQRIWVPRMLGYGGIAVYLLPNGATYYYVGDNNEHSWFGGAREAFKLYSADD